MSPRSVRWPTATRMGFRPQLAWATLSVNRRGREVNALRARRFAYRSIGREHEQHGGFAELAAIGGEWYAFAAEDADAACFRLCATTRLTREKNSLRHDVCVSGQLPSAHRLGFAVKVLGDGGLPSHDTRRWSSDPHLRRSLKRLRDILDYLERHDIRMYRLPTALAPYASHPDMPQFHRQVQECAEELAQVGAVVRERAIRLSSHPGQYTVLNSENPDTQAAAIAELEVQAALMDAMGLGPEAVVVLHVGGAAGGLDAARDRFLAGFECLSERARTRLVVENDDRTFGLVDVLALSARSGVRIVWDVLHHRCHDPAGMSNREALAAALDTWRDGDGLPKIHYSSPRLDVEQRRVKVGRRTETKLVLPQLRAHADLIDPIGFEAFLRDAPAGRSFDIMLEAKAKDLALLRLREQLAERGLVSTGGSVLVAGS